MLKKKQRLSRSEFQTLLKHGKRLQNTHLTLVSSPSKELKCGLVVSKKIAKQAPKRNHLRRRVYTILGELLKNQDNIHVAVIAKTGSQNLAYKELKETLIELVRKVNQ